jgi:hypothetical protein
MSVITRRSFIAMGTSAACAAGRFAPRAETIFDFYLGKPPYSEHECGLRRLYRDLSACGVAVVAREYDFSYSDAQSLCGTVSTTLTAYGDFFPAAFGRLLRDWRREGQWRAVSITRDDW